MHSCEVEGNVHKQKLNLHFLSHKQLLYVMISSTLHRRYVLGEVIIFLQYTLDCGCSVTKYDKEYFYWS